MQKDTKNTHIPFYVHFMILIFFQSEFFSTYNNDMQDASTVCR